MYPQPLHFERCTIGQYPLDIMSTTGSTKATEAKAAGPKEEAVTVKPLKLATPTIFTSNRKKLDTFLLQLVLYFKFN